LADGPCSRTFLISSSSCSCSAYASASTPWSRGSARARRIRPHGWSAVRRASRSAFIEPGGRARGGEPGLASPAGEPGRRPRRSCDAQRRRGFLVRAATQKKNTALRGHSAVRHARREGRCTRGVHGERREKRSRAAGGIAPAAVGIVHDNAVRHRVELRRGSCNRGCLRADARALGHGPRAQRDPTGDFYNDEDAGMDVSITLLFSLPAAT
jgi:hypothetical protein